MITRVVRVRVRVVRVTEEAWSIKTSPINGSMPPSLPPTRFFNPCCYSPPPLPAAAASSVGLDLAFSRFPLTLIPKPRPSPSIFPSSSSSASIPSSIPSPSCCCYTSGGGRSRRGTTAAAAAASGADAMMLHQNPVISDLLATGLAAAIALSLLRFWQETAKRGIFDQKLNRKLVHISIGLAFMLCWPLFSSGWAGAIFAALTPGVNIIRMLLVGSGIMKDEETVKSMSRFGDHRELLKGPLYYATTITVACAIYWRTSPIAIAAVCNLCAGDGLADIVGRRFGTHKLPYNRNKSIAGSVAMALGGYFASLGYMRYFASFGYIRESWEMALGFLVVSLASAVVESLPISTELDDNLTVTLASVLVGSLVF